jgi:hypothetical protein
VTRQNLLAMQFSHCLEILMRRTHRILVQGLITILLLPLWGCVAHDASAIQRKREEERRKQYDAVPHYVAKYDVVLVAVERPALAQERYAEISMGKVPGQTVSINMAEDRLMKIVWGYPEREIVFEML